MSRQYVRVQFKLYSKYTSFKVTIGSDLICWIQIMHRLHNFQHAGTDKCIIEVKIKKEQIEAIRYKCIHLKSSLWMATWWWLILRNQRPCKHGLRRRKLMYLTSIGSKSPDYRSKNTPLEQQGNPITAIKDAIKEIAL